MKYPYITSVLAALLSMASQTVAFASAPSGWVVYKNPNYGFTLGYPANKKLITKNFDNDVEYLFSAKWEVFGETPGKLLLSIPLLTITESHYPHYAAKFRVGVSKIPAETKREDCIKKNYISKESINNKLFYVYDISDAAMGHFLTGKSYRTVHNGFCFAIEVLNTGTSTESYAPEGNIKPIPENKLKLSHQMAEKILHSFSFIKK